jgi:hypothetical protein
VRKVFHFDSPRERYSCDAVVISCFDHRFHLAIRKFLKRRGIVSPDSIALAGGAKSLASPSSEHERAFVLEQVTTSQRLHGSRRVILMNHSDCGAYGGLAKFNGDFAFEARQHCLELKQAAAVLRQEIPDLAVECFFVAFDGVLEATAGEVDPDTSSSPQAGTPP